MRLGSPKGDSRTKLWVPAGQSIQELRPLSGDQEPESRALPISFTPPGLHPINESLCYQSTQLFLSPALGVTSRDHGKVPAQASKEAGGIDRPNSASY